ncbi:hypothetical protein BBK82_34000 [Lentzea guizhouensis]|uniref:Uncharacterized protein n=1 Tax=Lentzea guizhouensis TaxID=1586287 RepID=A0A1B2HRE0_9PSEU|nr:hypothetical protein [Lentzea guizhouensis]ANZ40300.1 hypothetical protein BBK82_34000 [Lentzea guizhouensis]
MPADGQADLFREPVLTDTAPSLADGRAPRGLTPGGWVRTTGWLQVGHHAVSSPLLAATTSTLWALVAAAALVRTFPVLAGVLVLATPVVCGGSWWLVTARIKPASPARNTGTKHADELAAGDVVRLHGSIGPVGRVVAVTVGERAEVVFHGGSHGSWDRGRTVHLAQLLG